MKPPGMDDDIWKQFRNQLPKGDLLLLAVGALLIVGFFYCAVAGVTVGAWNYATHVLLWDVHKTAMLAFSALALLHTIRYFTRISKARTDEAQRFLGYRNLFFAAFSLLCLVGVAQAEWGLPRELPFATCAIGAGGLLIRNVWLLIQTEDKSHAAGRTCFCIVLLVVLVSLVQRYLTGEAFWHF